jgi:hypothetical protein
VGEDTLKAFLLTNFLISSSYRRRRRILLESAEETVGRAIGWQHLSKCLEQQLVGLHRRSVISKRNFSILVNVKLSERNFNQILYALLSRLVVIARVFQQTISARDEGSFHVKL